MWRVSLLENSLNLTKDFKKDLKEKVRSKKIDMNIHYYNLNKIDEEQLNDCLFDENTLFFNEDHHEHIDYLYHNNKLISLINKHKLKGEIKFGCLDGDQFGEFWGYSFNNGKMKKIKAKLNWK